MPRRSKNAKVEPSTYRVMIERQPFNHSHIDFASKDEALQYVHDLNDSSIAWYGVYEISPICDYLIHVENKRLIPHDDRIIITKPNNSSSTTNNKVKRRKSPNKVNTK